MTSISSVSSAWSGMGMQRSQRAAPSPERLMSKIDTDQSGSIDNTELQGLLDKVAQKTGTQLSASDVLTQFDADGNGQLSSDELGKTMQSILPPPSTMDFAQRRASSSNASADGTGQAGDDLFSKVDSDGNGSVSKDELQALLEKMSGGTASQTGVGSDDAFAALDTDGDGSLTQAEFDAGRPTGQGGHGGGGVGGPGGMPPPPPAGAAQGSNSSTASAQDDALDTNGDGVVSLSERLAGEKTSVQQDAVAALFQSIDTDGDQQISSSESSAFIQALTSAYGSSSTSTASSPRGELMHLAELARQRYAETASAWSGSTSSNALSAVA